VVVRRVVPSRSGDRRQVCAAFAGLQAGDRVALFMANCPQYLELLYGIWHAGLVAVPINHKLHAREVAFISTNSAASLLFVAGDLAGPKWSWIDGAVKNAGPAHRFDRHAGIPATRPTATRSPS
jgi:acyl-CoA synthetase (AMP-forming)/AMP-acid ligase II